MPNNQKITIIKIRLLLAVLTLFTWAIGSGVFWAGWIGLDDVRELNQNPLKTQGVITGGIEMQRHQSHSLYYAFRVKGVRYEGSGMVSGANYDALNIGDKVTVTYAANNPYNNRIDADWKGPAFAIVMMIGGALSILFGTAVLWFQIILTKKRKTPAAT